MTKVTFHKSDMDGNKYTVEGIARLSFTIKAAMKYRGWSERKLASHAGVSHVTINKYVRANIHEPQPDILRAIAPFIFKVTSIDVENIELNSEETYDDDWQALEKIATANFNEILKPIAAANLKSDVTHSSSESTESKVAETPTKFKAKAKSKK